MVLRLPCQDFISVGKLMKNGYKILKLIMATVCVSALLSIDVVFAQQKPTTAQTSTQKSLSDIDAVDAYTFAKDVAEVNQNDPVFKALENAHNKQFGEGNEADGELKAGNYVQCGASLCNLDTHFCYKETNYWSTGQGGSISNCVCSDKELPLKGENNSAYSGVTRSLMTMGCSSFTNQQGKTYDQFLTMTGSDGKKYQVHLGSTISVQYANESNKATFGCEVLPVKLYNYRKCFFCPLVGVIYDGSAKITDIAFSKMAAAFATLLAIGFAIWVALQVLTQVSSITKQDAPKFLGGLIKQSYKVIIAFVLLQNSQQIFEYAVRPILETGLVFGQNMLTTQRVFANIDVDGKGNYIRQAKEVTGGEHYKLGTYDKLEQFVVAVQREIAFMQAIGTSLICTGSNLMLFKGEISEFGDGFQMFVQGVVLAIFGFLLSISFVFYLIDAIVQFGVVGALLPFLIAAWPFKVTTKYTGTGTQMLLNSAFVFLFIGLVISANIHLINQALSLNSGEKQDELLELCEQPKYFNEHKEQCEDAFDTPRMGTLYEIAKTLNSLDSTKLKELTDISAMGFLILLFCCIFGFKFTNQAGSLADKFASGGIGKPIAPGIATMGASFAKSAATRATKNVREAAGDRLERGVKWAVGLAPRGMKAAWNKVRGKDKKPATSGSAPSQATGNTSSSGTSGNEAFNGGHEAAVLNEKSKNEQTPTLNEQAQGQKPTPTLNEAHNAQNGAPSSERDRGPTLSEAGGETVSSSENEADAAPDPTPDEPQEDTPSKPQQTTARAEKPQAAGQASRTQRQGRSSAQPRRPQARVQSAAQTRHQTAKGGSRRNRKKQLRRKK